MGDPRDVRERLLAAALSLPGAYEDHPWGEDVAKVNRKVFVFFGVADDDRHPPGFGVKLTDPDVHAAALSIDGAAPSGYGLGKAGWVSVPLTGELPPIDVLLEWVQESYRVIAPKRLVAELDARTGS
jgi:predicted DNA-binding protein (MmcQ/YjbR family)